MACTATVTLSMKQEVIEILEMSGCVEVNVSPDRQNIYYSVRPRTDISADFAALITTLRTDAVKTPRVIVYCQTMDMCSDLYAHFRSELGDAAYHPPGCAQVSDNRLFGIFHSDTPEYNKDVILRSLLLPDGVVRVVFATIALGMGIDLKDVNTIIHYQAPCSIEDYYQESGRGGRSGADALSIVFWQPRDCILMERPITPRDHEQITVRRYVENTDICRRRWLLGFFGVDPGGQRSRCCDVCSFKQGSAASYPL